MERETTALICVPSSALYFVYSQAGGQFASTAFALPAAGVCAGISFGGNEPRKAAQYGH